MAPPHPDELFTVDTDRCWPMGALKFELADGHPYFYGDFGPDDVETAERAFPGRPATLEPHAAASAPGGGNLVIHSARCTADCPLWGRG